MEYLQSKHSCHITTPKQAMKGLSLAISATSHCLKGGSTGPTRDHAKFDDVKDGPAMTTSSIDLSPFHVLRRFSFFG